MGKQNLICGYIGDVYEPVISFNEKVVSKNFSLIMVCRKKNDTYYCGEIPIKSDGITREKVLTIVLPICLIIFFTFVGALVYVKIRQYYLRKKQLKIQQAVLHSDYKKVMDLELGVKTSLRDT